MASNNYAVEIDDNDEALEVLAKFERLAHQGWSFKILEFNPDVHRFAIYGGRESNFPPLPEVECFGTSVTGAYAKVLWKTQGSVRAIDFGNGHVGLFCYASVPVKMVILDDEQRAAKCDSVDFDGATQSACLNPPVYTEADSDSGRIVGYCTKHFEELSSERRKNRAALAPDLEEDLL